MDDKIQLLYDALKDTYELGTIEDFYKYLQDDNKRKMFYNEVIEPMYDVESLQEFESTYALGVKKKDISEPVGDTEGTMASTTEQAPASPTSLDSQLSKENQPLDGGTLIDSGEEMPQQKEVVEEIIPDDKFGVYDIENETLAPLDASVQSEVTLEDTPTPDVYRDLGSQDLKNIELEAKTKQKKLVEAAEKAIIDDGVIAKEYDMTPEKYRLAILDTYAKKMLDGIDYSEYETQQKLSYLQEQKNNLPPGSSALEGMDSEIKSLEKKRSEYVNSRIAQVGAQIENIKATIDYSDKSDTKEKLEEIKKLQMSLKPVINPVAYAREKAETSDVKAMPGANPMEQLTNYYHSIAREYSDIASNTNTLEMIASSVPILGDIVGSRQDRDRFYELRQELIELTPIVTLNRKELKEDNFFSQFAKGTVGALLSPNIVTTEQEQANKLYSSFEAAGVSGSLSKETDLALQESLDITLMEEIGSMTGFVAGMMPAFMGGGAIVQRLGTVARNANLLNKVDKFNKMNKATRLLVSATTKGLEYEAAGAISTSSTIEEEASFLSGFMGETFTRGLSKLVPKKVYNATMLKLFGGSSNKVKDIFMKSSAKVASKIGYGFGEVAEEYGNEIGNIIDESDGDLKKFIDLHSERFGDFDENVKFGLMTFGMGMAFGAATNSGKAFMKTHMKWLSEQTPEVQSEFTTIASDIKKDLDSVAEDAEQIALEEPSESQLQDDAKNGESEILYFENENDIPDIYKDKTTIKNSIRLEANGKYTVMVEKSLIDYYESTKQVEEVVAEAAPVVENVITEEVDANPRKDKAPVYRKGGKKLLFTGSPRKFTTFDMSKVGSNADGGSPQGIFFSNDPGIAGFYANEVNGDGMGQLLNMVGLGKLKGIEPTIYSAVLNTENIREVEFDGKTSSSTMDKNAIIKKAFEEGFDAVVLKNIKDGPSVPQDVTVVKDIKFIDQFEDTQDGRGRKISKNLANKADKVAPVAEEAVAEEVVAEAVLDETTKVSDVVGKRATVKGSTGVITSEGGGKISLYTDNGKIIEIGNLEEIGDQSLKIAEIEMASDIVSIEDGNILVRGKKYNNNYSDPLAALNADEDGNIISVTLDAENGTKRTFKGNVADELAYNIIQSQYENQELELELENLYNTDEETRQLIDEVESIKETADKTKTQDTEQDSETEETVPVAQETTTEEITIFRGVEPKKDVDGKPKTVHKIKKGKFGSAKIEGTDGNKGTKPIKKFNIPAGTTVETVKLPGNTPAATSRVELETAAIDNSTAQVVKLETIDASGTETQYIIKDDSLLESGVDMTAEEEALARSKPKKRLISDEAYAKAEKELKDMMGNLSSGTGFKGAGSLAVVVARKLEDGIISVAEMTTEMVKIFGEAIRPHVQAAYDTATKPKPQKKRKTETQTQKSIDAFVDKKMSSGKTINLSEKNALKKQISDFARGMTEAYKDQKTFKKKADKLISENFKLFGNLSPSKVKALTRRALNIDFSKPISLDKFIEYAAGLEQITEDNLYKETVSNVKKKTAPKKLRKRKGGILKGKIANYEGKVLSNIHNAIRESNVSFIENRIKALKEKEEKTGELNESEIALLESSFISIELLSGNLKTAQNAENKVDALIDGGKSKYREDLKKRSEEYVRLVTESLPAITGGKKLTDQFGKLEQGAKRKPLTEAIREKISGFLDLGEGLRTLLDKIDRTATRDESGYGGFLDKELYEPIADGRRKKDGLDTLKINELSSKLDELYGKRKKKDLKSNQKVESLGKFIDRDGNEVELFFSQNQAYPLYQYMQDPSNIDTFEEMGFTNEMLEAIEESLTPEVKKWADWQMSEFFPKYYDEINAVYKEMNDIDLPKQKIYVPIIRKVEDSNEKEVGIDQIMFGNPESTYKSLNQRQNSKAAFDMTKDGNEKLMEYVEGMNTYISFSKPVKNLNVVFKNNKIRRAVKEFNSKETLQAIDGFIERIANNSSDLGKRIALLDKLRGNVTLSSLALAPTITIKQLTSIPAYAVDIPTKKFISGMGSFARNPKKAAEILMKSEYMQKRYKDGFERDILEGMKRDYDSILKGTSNLKNKMMFLIKWGDKGAILMGGYSVYKYHFDKSISSGKTNEESKKIALSEFEEATKLSQQSTNPEDLSEFQAMGSLGKLFTMYMTSPMSYFRQERKSARDFVKGFKAKNKKLMKNSVKRLLTYHFVLPVVFQFVANGLPGILTDWDDEDEKDLKRAASIGSFNGVFIAGQLMSYLGDVLTDKAWVSGGKFSPSPAFDAIANIINQSKDVVEEWSKDQEGFSDDLIKEIIELGLSLDVTVGLPVNRVKKLLENWMTIADDNDLETREKIALAIGYSPYVVTPKSKEKKGFGKSGFGKSGFGKSGFGKSSFDEGGFK